MIRPSAWAAIVCAIVAAFFFMLLIINWQVGADWKPEYASNPPEVQAWFRNAEVMPAARHRLPYTKCCDHADVVKTRFFVNERDGKDEWFYEDSPSHLKRIPDDIIHWGEGAPGGKPTLFVFQGLETCFFPGEGGL